MVVSEYSAYVVSMVDVSNTLNAQDGVTHAWSLTILMNIEVSGGIASISVELSSKNWSEWRNGSHWCGVKR